MMTDATRRVQRTYLLLTLLSTLFLLDAGLSNGEAFAANAFFTAGMMVFEVPTGALADTWGRRVSYLLGAATLLLSTLLYLAMWRMHAPFWGWAVASILLGLGFTFFSGATEAWLVDALAASGYKEGLEAVMARGQVAGGAAMLAGSVAGGAIAQASNLGVPYVIRSVCLGLTLVAAFLLMKDEGFTPDRSVGPVAEVRRVVRASLDNGWRKPPVRWLMLSGLFTGGVMTFAFYGLQPYLLELYGDPRAFGIAGLAAAIVAGTGMLAGVIAPYVRRRFARHTTALIVLTAAGTACLALMGATRSFPVAIAALVIWGLAYSAALPIRQGYLNGLLPSHERATVLSLDNLMASAGGVVTQPALGRAADVWGYPVAYLIGAAVHLAALPFLFLARRERAGSDPIE